MISSICEHDIQYQPRRRWVKMHIKCASLAMQHVAGDTTTRRTACENGCLRITSVAVREHFDSSSCGRVSMWSLQCTVRHSGCAVATR
jgi:hypothetical protein